MCPSSHVTDNSVPSRLIWSARILTDSLVPWARSRVLSDHARGIPKVEQIWQGQWGSSCRSKAAEVRARVLRLHPCCQQQDRAIRVRSPEFHDVPRYGL